MDSTYTTAKFNNGIIREGRLKDFIILLEQYHAKYSEVIYCIFQNPFFGSENKRSSSKKKFFKSH